MIELFQKFAGFGAEPHFNAKASAFASVLQNPEAELRDFGQSQYFPNVGKYCALSLRKLEKLATPNKLFVLFKLKQICAKKNKQKREGAKIFPEGKILLLPNSLRDAVCLKRKLQGVAPHPT